MSYVKFLISGLYDLRKVIKDTPTPEAWRCHASNFMSLGCQEGHQRHHFPPSLELDPWRTGGF